MLFRSRALMCTHTHTPRALGSLGISDRLICGALRAWSGDKAAPVKTAGIIHLNLPFETSLVKEPLRRERSPWDLISIYQPQDVGQCVINIPCTALSDHLMVYTSDLCLYCWGKSIRLLNQQPYREIENHLSNELWPWTIMELQKHRTCVS